MTYVPALAMAIAGVGLLWWSFARMKFVWGIVTVVVGGILLSGSVVVAIGALATDYAKGVCLDITSQTTGRETKWSSGECYVRDRSGEFVREESYG